MNKPTRVFPVVNKQTGECRVFASKADASRFFLFNCAGPDWVIADSVFVESVYWDSEEQMYLTEVIEL